MTRSSAQKVDFVAKARAAWDLPPEWVMALAENCNRLGQAGTAKVVAYSPATVSQVLGNTYAGDLARVEEMVRGALMAETVVCPIKGAMGRNICLDWQAKPFAATSADRTRMYHACRSGCPYSKLKGKSDA